MKLEAGLTRVMIAEKLGVLRELIADMEAGKIETETELIEHIAIVLGRRLRDFAGELAEARGKVESIVEKPGRRYDVEIKSPP